VPSLDASSQLDRFQCDVANCLGEGFGAQLLKASMQGSQDTGTSGPWMTERDLELDGFSESFYRVVGVGFLISQTNKT